jgi:RhoGAP domain
MSAGNGEGMGAGGNKRTSLQIVHDRDMNGENDLTFGAQSIALDDIPRLVAAEQAREQRPNAARYARGNLTGSEPKVKLVNGHRRDASGGQELEQFATGDGQPRMKRYFSELSGLEYFIVRHIAVLSMEPLLEGHFNQQELLDLIENKRPTFWDRFGKAFKNEKGAKKTKGVFGKPLDQVVERDGADSTDGVGPGALRVPAVVEATVSAMRNMDMSVEGVFRKNGNIRRLKELAEEIDAKGSEAVDLTRETPIQVAALLKKFLRELPDPVLTHKLHRLWITGAKIQDEDRRRRVLHLTCCLLPKVHRDTMEVLFTFLNWAASFHTIDEETGSKMDLHNLATVIAPNLLLPSNKNPEVDSSLLAIETVYSLIECNESMCEVSLHAAIRINWPLLTHGYRSRMTFFLFSAIPTCSKTPPISRPRKSSSDGAKSAKCHKRPCHLVQAESLGRVKAGMRLPRSPKIPTPGRTRALYGMLVLEI